MRRNILETVLGAVVLASAAGFLAFAYQNSGVKKVEGYSIKARFQSVQGISTGSDVRLGGIKIGVVSALDLDPKTYEAIATLGLRNDIKVPADSIASIASDGLLGGKFVGLEPGAEDKMLAPGETLQYTQSAVSLESLIGKFMHGGAEGDAKPTANAGGMPAALPAAK